VRTSRAAKKEPASSPEAGSLECDVDGAALKAPSDCGALLRLNAPHNKLELQAGMSGGQLHDRDCPCKLCAELLAAAHPVAVARQDAMQLDETTGLEYMEEDRHERGGGHDRMGRPKRRR